MAEQIQTTTLAYGHCVFSITLSIISIPVGTCQAKSAIFITFKAMCETRANSFPFCIAGTNDAATIERQEI